MSPPSTSRTRHRHYRWAILAAGTFAQTGYAAIGFGVVVLAPAFRARYGLGLAEVGLLIAAPSLGSIATLYLWGTAADRAGERTVSVASLAGAAAFLAGAAFASSFAAVVVLLLLAGGAGAGVSAATGRAVMHWFDETGRGLALGVRQTSVPIAGFWVALVLPALVTGDDPKPALLTLAGVCAAGAIAAFVTLREHPDAAAAEDPIDRPLPLRDRTIWRLSGASALIIEPQQCLVGFLVVFLHAERGLSTAAAAGVLAAVNLLGIGTRIGVGRWSDLVRSRVGPFRAIALGCAASVALSTAVLTAPLGVLVPVLVVMGCVAISWNGLSFAAVAEAAGHTRSGTALGLQQTMLAAAGSVMPVAFGAFVGGTSWRAGFAVSALFPLAGWSILRGIRG